LSSRLPPHVEPAFDGLSLELPDPGGPGAGGLRPPKP
jgi:hypothetical protein